MNYIKPKKAFYGALLGTGLNIGATLIQNAKEKKEAKRQRRLALARAYGEKVNQDSQIANNFDTDGSQLDTFFFEKGGAINPSFVSNGGKLKKISSNVEKAIGNKHEENSIDGTSGIKLSKNGKEEVEIEGDELIKDGNKVYSNRLLDGSQTYAKKLEKLDNEKQEIENKIKKGVSLSKRNSLNRKKEIIDIKEDDLFNKQEQSKQQNLLSKKLATGGEIIEKSVPYLDNAFNLFNTLTKPKPTKPITTPVPTFNTEFNNTPQLNDVEQEINKTSDFIEDNTASSRVARGSMLATRLKGTEFKNKIRVQKENAENQLENQALSKTFNMNSQNNQLLNRHNDKLDLRSLAIRKELSDNVANVVDDTFNQKKYVDEKNLSERKLDLTEKAYDFGREGLSDRLNFNDDNSLDMLSLKKDKEKFKSVIKGMLNEDGTLKVKKATYNSAVNAFKRNHGTVFNPLLNNQ